jgi:hypothetical protein
MFASLNGLRNTCHSKVPQARELQLNKKSYSNKRKLVKTDTNPMAGKTKQKDGVGGRNKPTIKRIALKAYSE